MVIIQNYCMRSADPDEVEQLKALIRHTFRTAEDVATAQAAAESMSLSGEQLATGGLTDCHQHGNWKIQLQKEQLTGWMSRHLCANHKRAQLLTLLMPALSLGSDDTAPMEAPGPLCTPSAVLPSAQLCSLALASPEVKARACKESSLQVSPSYIGEGQTQ